MRIRECGPRSQPLVWGPEALERSNGPFVSFVCICVSLYPILDAGRVRFSESPVRFTRKRTKGVCKGKDYRQAYILHDFLRNHDSVKFGNYITDW